MNGREKGFKLTASALGTKSFIPPYSCHKNEFSIDMLTHIRYRWIETKMTEALSSDQIFCKNVVNRAASGRWGQLEDLAGTIIYLASRASNFITGEEILVYGGVVGLWNTASTPCKFFDNCRDCQWQQDLVLVFVNRWLLYQ